MKGMNLVQEHPEPKIQKSGVSEMCGIDEEESGN